MAGSEIKARRRILGVFAHPDDETTGCAGTFMRYAREGVEVYVATATRGEQGTLGTGGMLISREDLPAIREAELRSVLEVLGVNPPLFLGYKDQQLSGVDGYELSSKIGSVMRDTQPNVVITFGPTGISHHDDHIAVHRATLDAFRRYRESAPAAARLFYVAIPEEIASQLDLHLHPSETSPNVVIDIAAHKEAKIRAIRMFKSQEDAQQVAELFENNPFDAEAFHQACPRASVDSVSTGFWE